MKIFRLMALVLFGASLATFTMPAIQVHLPPLTTLHFSPWQLTKSVVKMTAKKDSKFDFSKKDFDFFDVLNKILPKNKNQKFSLTFILGALVPVAFAATYILFACGFLLRLVKVKFLATLSAFISIWTAGYALIGTRILGMVAEKQFQDTVEKAGGGFIGSIAKHFVSQVTILPDKGLYAMCIAAGVLFITSLILPSGD